MDVKNYILLINTLIPRDTFEYILEGMFLEYQLVLRQE